MARRRDRPEPEVSPQGPPAGSPESAATPPPIGETVGEWLDGPRGLVRVEQPDDYLEGSGSEDFSDWQPQASPAVLPQPKPEPRPSEVHPSWFPGGQKLHTVLDECAARCRAHHDGRHAAMLEMALLRLGEFVRLRESILESLEAVNAPPALARKVRLLMEDL